MKEVDKKVMEIDSRKMNRMVGIYEQLDRAGHLFGVYL